MWAGVVLVLLAGVPASRGVGYNEYYEPDPDNEDDTDLYAIYNEVDTEPTLMTDPPTTHAYTRMRIFGEDQSKDLEPAKVIQLFKVSEVNTEPILIMTDPPTTHANDRKRRFGEDQSEDLETAKGIKHFKEVDMEPILMTDPPTTHANDRKRRFGQDQSEDLEPAKGIRRYKLPHKIYSKPTRVTLSHDLRQIEDQSNAGETFGWRKGLPEGQGGFSLQIPKGPDGMGRQLPGPGGGGGGGFGSEGQTFPPGKSPKFTLPPNYTGGTDLEGIKDVGDKYGVTLDDMEAQEIVEKMKNSSLSSNITLTTASTASTESGATNKTTTKKGHATTKSAATNATTLNTTTTTTTTTTTKRTPHMDINAIIAIIANLTYDYEWNLTEEFNKTLIDHGVPTCPTGTTMSTTSTTPSQYDFSNTTVVGKCFVCGLKTPEIPRNAYCADAFAGDFLPLVPIDPRARGQIATYRKYCRYLDVHNYVENPSEPRSIYGRFTGGCGVRWTDLSGVYTQRTCRARFRPLMGKHFASKRMAKLELALINVENGCIISPMASLLPLSRGISLYARFHACVCTGSWCNTATREQRYLQRAAVTILLVFTKIVKYS